MTNWEECGRRRSWPNLRYYPVICLKGLRKTTKILTQDNRSPCRHLNLGLPKYEPGVLTTRLRRSVCVNTCACLSWSRKWGVSTRLETDRCVSCSTKVTVLGSAAVHLHRCWTVSPKLSTLLFRLWLYSSFNARAYVSPCQHDFHKLGIPLPLLWLLIYTVVPSVSTWRQTDSA
jgi:hypothetical protein